ncbi:MAG: DUF2029 domain-containing protein [Thermoleophilia bacterium]|nr:DUF2029 domain-containing protein [Thermoleophilia bacterium]
MAAAAALAVALFSASWALLHTGPWDEGAIVDTPLYQAYGERIAAGEIPYRDFALEYPPAALAVFWLPTLGAPGDYDSLFELAMLVCGAAAAALVPVALAAAHARGAWILGSVAITGLSPLLLGNVVLTRYDLWPAALLAGALTALAAGHARLAHALLAAGVAAKLYPLVVLPLALLYVARRRGAREVAVSLAIFASVLALLVVPFVVLAPHGVLESVTRQAQRPLQIESLGAGILLGLDRLDLYAARVVSSHGSQNLAGPVPDALADVGTVVQAVAVIAVWLLFSRLERKPAQLLTASAAAVAAFVAFGKVLSPQFLVWLLALVPLAAAVRPALALAGALVLTQLWFPRRYWDVVAVEPVAWLVVCRDLVLVALALTLLAATRRTPEARGSR